jgi:hypothetical protein
MASQVFDSTEAQVVMREILDGNFYKQFEEESVFFGMFPDGSAPFVNDVGAQWVNDLEPNPGMKGMSATDVTFHVGSTSKRARSKITFAEFAITRIFDGRILHTDVKSLIKGWAPMLQQDMSTFMKQLNLLWHGDGSGTLATLSGTPTTAAVTFAQPIGATQLLRRGNYNIVDAATLLTKRTMTIGGVAKSSLYLVSKTGANIGNFADDEADTAADTITATTAVDGDVVIWPGTGAAAPKGLWYHLNNDTGTYQNLSRATYPQFIPPIFDAGNGPLTVRILDHVEYDLIYAAGQEQTLNGMFWLSAPTQCAAYKKLGYNTDVVTVKRFGAGDRQLDLGYDTITHNGRTFMIDVDARQDRLAFLNRPTWEKYVAKPPSVVNDTGQVLNSVYASSLALMWRYTFNLNFLGELACRQIRKNAGVTNLQWQDLPIKGNVQSF